METEIVTTITEQLPVTLQSNPLVTTGVNGLEVYLNDSGDFMENLVRYINSTTDYINNILNDIFNAAWYYGRYISEFVAYFVDNGLPSFFVFACSASLFFIWYSFLRGR